MHTSDRSSQDAEPLRGADATALEALLELSPDAVFVVDERGTIRRANELAAELFATTVDVLEGRSVDRLVPVEVRERHRADRANYGAAPIARSMNSGRELHALRSDGTRFPVDIALRPLRVAGRLFTIAVVRDLTAYARLRAQNEELLDLSNLLRRFVDVASHELRTPLTAVRGFAETLLHVPETPDGQRELLLERIVANATRQEALIDGLLDLSRIQRGQLTLDPTVARLDHIVREVVDAVSLPEAPTVSVPEVEVVVDVLRLEQILTNLLTNAGRYGGPPFQVEGSLEADAFIVRVRDHGPGVDGSFEPALFQAFEQASRGDRRQATGLGLGLYLSRQLAEAMGGTLHHEREGLRTCFSVRLPRGPEQRTLSA